MPGVTIPEAWQGLHAIGRVCTSGLANYRDIQDWKYSWQEIYDMHDMLDLNDWISWEAHVISSGNNGNN